VLTAPEPLVTLFDSPLLSPVPVLQTLFAQDALVITGSAIADSSEFDNEILALLRFRGEVRDIEEEFAVAGSTLQQLIQMLNGAVNTFLVSMFKTCFQRLLEAMGAVPQPNVAVPSHRAYSQLTEQAIQLYGKPIVVILANMHILASASSMALVSLTKLLPEQMTESKRRMLARSYALPVLLKMLAAIGVPRGMKIVLVGDNPAMQPFIACKCGAIMPRVSLPAFPIPYCTTDCVRQFVGRFLDLDAISATCAAKATDFSQLEGPPCLARTFLQQLRQLYPKG
jgi:hypothetical protein